MKMDLRATPEEVMRAVAALEQMARDMGLEERTVFGLTLALEECASNIVNHALGRDPERTFQVSFEREGGRFAIELRDSGPPFDPTAAALRPLSAADEDSPGGWGIQLVRRHIDRIGYRREGGENVLRLEKTLPPAGQSGV